MKNDVIASDGNESGINRGFRILLYGLLTLLLTSNQQAPINLLANG
jgi:hypothetical protein